jgi:hypothetical protein
MCGRSYVNSMSKHIIVGGEMRRIKGNTGMVLTGMG